MDAAADSYAPDGARRLLAEGLAALSLSGRPELERDLAAFLGLLAQWNRAYNLTAVRDPEDMVARHLLDSLAVLPWLPAGRIVDLGTGAGLPGIPLALAAPDREFTLVDSVGKKLRFVRHACRALNLENVTTFQGRIEDYRPEQPFDAAVARALTAVDRLALLARPLLRPGGVLLAMTGRDPRPVDTVPGFDTPEVAGVKVPTLAAERHLVIFPRTRGPD